MRKTRLLGRFVALACMATSQSAWAVSLVEIDSARVKGLAYLYQSQKGDGSWSAHDSLKVQTTASALEALVNAGIKTGKTYGSAAAWLANAETASVDSTARKIASLAITGMNMKPHALALLAQRTASDRQIWGAYPQYGISFPDTPLGIAAIRLSGYSYTDQTNDLKRALACEVLPAQRVEVSGKGWSYAHKATGEAANISGSGSALLPTAITLLEVASVRAAYGWTSVNISGTGCSNFNLTTVLDDGVAYLLTKQNADNGFGENGVSTPLQTALVYLAIKAVNAAHTALPLAQDYLLTGGGQQAPDGSWGGDPLATALVLKTLPALSLNTLSDTDHDGVPDEIELAMNSGTSTTHADGRDMLAPGNGQAVPGLNSPILAASVRYLHPMAPLQLSPSGATTYTITNGVLPPGITMDGIGILSGTPTQIGTFSFSYSPTSETTTLAQLVVTPPDGDLNNDGQLDVADIALLERIQLGLATATSLQQVSADVSPVSAPDNVIDLADLQRLKRMALGLE